MSAPVEFPGNIIPAPGYWKGGSTVDDELLYSAVGYTQKGITLKAGQGVLQLGQAMARETATKKWVKYNNAGGGGTDVCRGILRQTVDTGTDAAGKEFQGNLVIRGILKNSKIAGIDAPGIADLVARVDTVLDTFTF
jgi:hypothetical protein